MRALVLSGGGANGAWQAGVMSYLLREKGYKYDIVCGVSVGALNGAMLCEFPIGQELDATDRILRMWNGVTTKKIYRKWWVNLLPEFLGVFFKGSAYNSGPLQELVRSSLKADAVKNSGRHLVVGAVRWGDESDYQTFDETTQDLAAAVLASSAMPIFFEDIRIGSDWYTDGGLRDVTPIGAAIEAGAETIDIVNCSTGRLEKGVSKPKGLDKILRSFSIAIDEIDRSDFEATEHINARVKMKDPAALARGWKVVEVRRMSPPADLGSSLDFSHEKNMAQIKAGLEHARRSGW